MPPKEPHARSIHTAYFRFYEELNDFLAKPLRKQTLTYPFTGKPSVKDAIEAIGIPHTEVELIIINGESVGFDQPLRHGDRISVYPVFESLDISPLIRLRAKPLRETKFILDANVGKLAHKLRLLGFDSLFSSDYSDPEIVEISVTQKRIILTRDKDLLKHRKVTHGYWIRSDEPEHQVIEVIRRLQLEHRFNPFTRCSACNGRMRAAAKAEVTGQVPPKILGLFNEYLVCDSCGQVYWKGSHYDRILAWIERLKTTEPNTLNPYP